MTVSISGNGVATFSGRNGAGSISVPGMKAGDRIIIEFLPGVSINLPGGQFESIVSVDDEIQQTNNSNFSAVTCTLYFWRGL